MTDTKTSTAKVKSFLYFIWPTATLGILILLGVSYHATKWMWISSVALYLAGDAIELVQAKSPDGTTLFPYVVEVVAVALMGLLAGTQALTFAH